MQASDRSVGVLTIRIADKDDIVKRLGHGATRFGIIREKNLADANRSRFFGLHNIRHAVGQDRAWHEPGTPQLSLKKIRVAALHDQSFGKHLENLTANQPALLNAIRTNLPYVL